jgi:DNA-binding protein
LTLNNNHQVKASIIVKHSVLPRVDLKKLQLPSDTLPTKHVASDGSHVSDTVKHIQKPIN